MKALIVGCEITVSQAGLGTANETVSYRLELLLALVFDTPSSLNLHVYNDILDC